MKKPLYVFATRLEAQIPLEKNQASIFIAGMCPLPAAVKLAEHLTKHSFTEVINIGFAGALKDHHPYGQFYEIDRLGKQYYPDIFLKTRGRFPTASLFTSDFAIQEEKLRKKLGLEYDLVDMEGWALAWTCAHFKIPCQFIKVVSDFCSETTSDEILEKGRELSQLINDCCF